MQCTHCGTTLTEGVKFCPNCGTSRADINKQLPRNPEQAASVFSDPISMGASIGEKHPRLVLSILAIVGLAVFIAWSSGVFHSADQAQLPHEQTDTPSAQPQTVDRNEQANDELRNRCITQAKTQGYRNGQCAYGFINECITTQSRSKMEAWLRMDAATGVGTGLSCPNMPSTFVDDFNKLDKF